MSTEEEGLDRADRGPGTRDARQGCGMPRASRGRQFLQDAVPALRRTHVFRVSAFVPFVLLALVVLPGSAVAQMYRWVDEQGEVHLTDDPNSIPPQHRSRGGQVTPQQKSPAPSTPPGSADSGRPSASGAGGVALWLRTGGLRGEQEPILIQVYDSQETCMAERDRRTAMHVSQGMQPTSQPGLSMSTMGRSPAGDHYFAYRCVPAGIPPPP
jgi:uncharacterized protein DUF4124